MSTRDNLKAVIEALRESVTRAEQVKRWALPE
jgi:hypothetical protein